jgi:hypothetical protein
LSVLTSPLSPTIPNFTITTFVPILSSKTILISFDTVESSSTLFKGIPTSFITTLTATRTSFFITTTSATAFFTRNAFSTISPIPEITSNSAIISSFPHSSFSVVPIETTITKTFTSFINVIESTSKYGVTVSVTTTSPTYFESTIITKTTATAIISVTPKLSSSSIGTLISKSLTEVLKTTSTSQVIQSPGNYIYFLILKCFGNLKNFFIASSLSSSLSRRRSSSRIVSESSVISSQLSQTTLPTMFSPGTTSDYALSTDYVVTTVDDSFGVTTDVPSSSTTIDLETTFVTTSAYYSPTITSGTSTSQRARPVASSRSIVTRTIRTEEYYHSNNMTSKRTGPTGLSSTSIQSQPSSSFLRVSTMTEFVLPKTSDVITSDGDSPTTLSTLSENTTDVLETLVTSSTYYAANNAYGSTSSKPPRPIASTRVLQTRQMSTTSKLARPIPSARAIQTRSMKTDAYYNPNINTTKLARPIASSRKLSTRPVPSSVLIVSSSSPTESTMTSDVVLPTISDVITSDEGSPTTSDTSPESSITDTETPIGSSTYLAAKNAYGSTSSKPPRPIASTRVLQTRQMSTSSKLARPMPSTRAIQIRSMKIETTTKPARPIASSRKLLTRPVPSSVIILSSSISTVSTDTSDVALPTASDNVTSDEGPPTTSDTSPESSLTDIDTQIISPTYLTANDVSETSTSKRVRPVASTRVLQTRPVGGDGGYNNAYKSSSKLARPVASTRVLQTRPVVMGGEGGYNNAYKSSTSKLVRPTASLRVLQTRPAVAEGGFNNVLKSTSSKLARPVASIRVLKTRPPIEKEGGYNNVFTTTSKLARPTASTRVLVTRPFTVAGYNNAKSSTVSKPARPVAATRVLVTRPLNAGGYINALGAKTNTPKVSTRGLGGSGQSMQIKNFKAEGIESVQSTSTSPGSNKPTAAQNVNKIANAEPLKSRQAVTTDTSVKFKNYIENGTPNSEMSVRSVATLKPIVTRGRLQDQNGASVSISRAKVTLKPIKTRAREESQFVNGVNEGLHGVDISKKSTLTSNSERVNVETLKPINTRARGEGSSNINLEHTTTQSQYVSAIDVGLNEVFSSFEPPTLTSNSERVSLETLKPINTRARGEESNNIINLEFPTTQSGTQSWVQETLKPIVTRERNPSVSNSTTVVIFYNIYIFIEFEI